MSYQKQKFGMMDQAYFVPKSEILTWINDLLKLNISKIQALGSGSIYCQILDAIHPGKVALNKVNWKAKNDYDFIANLRILQNSLEKAGIKHYIDVEKIAKAKYQDNLELIQWFKRYFDLNSGTKGQGYQAEQRRGGVVPDFSFSQKIVIPKSYNATGQVINKNLMVSPAKKAQQGAKINRIRSPVSHQQKQKQKQPTQRTKSKQIVKKPQTANIIKPITKKQGETANQPPIPKKSGSSQNIAEQTDKKFFGQIEVLKKQSKQMRQKLQMIKEIALSQDASDMKLMLIQQILEIGPSPLNEKKNKSQVKPIFNSSNHPQSNQQSQLLAYKDQVQLQENQLNGHYKNGENVYFSPKKAQIHQNIQVKQNRTQNQPEFFEQSHKPSTISEDDCI